MTDIDVKAPAVPTMDTGKARSVIQARIKAGLPAYEDSCPLWSWRPYQPK